MRMTKKDSELTRADLLREQREQTSRERVRRPAASSVSNRSRETRETRTAPSKRPAAASLPRSVRATQPPPVISRGGVVGTPVHKKTGGKARRQYYYSLSTPGAEIRLPSMPAVNFGWRGVSAIVSMMLLAAVFALWNAPQFQIADVRVFGAQRIGGAEILDTLNVEGLPIVEADPVELRESVLRSFPELSSVSVQIGLPARLAVTVVERTPVLAWEQNGQQTWIDQEGFAFPPRGDPGVALPLIRAEGAPPAPAVPVPAEDAEGAAEADPQLPQEAVLLPFMDPAMVQPMVDLSARVPEGQVVSYSPQYGLGWMDPQGWQVYFGKDIQDLDIKLQQYQAIVDELSKKGLRPSMISVEFLHAPFYRLEQ